MKPLIKSADHVKTGRTAVFRTASGFWYASTGKSIHGHFRTHAEAITYAQEKAKTEALKEPS